MTALLDLDGNPLLSQDKQIANDFAQKSLLIDQLKSLVELAIDSAKQRWNKNFKDDKISLFIKGGVIDAKSKAFLELHAGYRGAVYVIFREEKVFSSTQELYANQIEWEYDLILALVRGMILGAVDSFVMRMQIQLEMEQHEQETQQQPEDTGTDCQAVEQETKGN